MKTTDTLVINIDTTLLAAADAARTAADQAADVATGDVEIAYVHAWSLAYVLEILEVPTAGLSYDDMTSDLASIADYYRTGRERAEEVTRNCHIIALSLIRNLRLTLTPEQTAWSKAEIVALRDCAAEHDGAEDWLVDAIKEFTK